MGIAFQLSRPYDMIVRWRLAVLWKSNILGPAQDGTRTSASLETLQPSPGHHPSPLQMVAVGLPLVGRSMLPVETSEGFETHATTDPRRGLAFRPRDLARRLFRRHPEP